jgi:hypothetical protein
MIPAPARTDPSAGSTPSLKPEIMAALEQSGFYIAPAMQHDVDARKISATLREADITARVLLLERLPPGVSSTRQLAQAVHEYSHLGDGLIVVLTEHPRSIVAYGAGLDSETMQQIADAPAKTFDAEGYAAGVAQIVRLVDQERANRRAARIQFVILPVGVALVLSILFMRCRKRSSV